MKQKEKRMPSLKFKAHLILKLQMKKLWTATKLIPKVVLDRFLKNFTLERNMLQLLRQVARNPTAK